MRSALIASLIFVSSLAAPATAQVRVSININVPTYPVLQRVPNYPVYYAPRLNANYFFYDGLYWIYEGDDWYASPWYNGPWERIDRFDVPVYLLRVPVRYYRSAPVYFRSWTADAPPRWGDHWGATWVQRRSGWDQWNRSSSPAPAPLPVYQRQYSGSRYPDASQQVVIQTKSYTYQPREAVVQQRFTQYRASVPASQVQQTQRRTTTTTTTTTQVQREAPVVRAQRADDRGHPPGKAKGWEGADRPPGQAKGWDKDKDDRGPPDDRGKGRDKEDHPGKGKGRDKDR